MALKRIAGSVIRHPLATTALVAGVAKGAVGAARKLARGENPLTSSDDETSPGSTSSDATQSPAPTEATSAPKPAPEPEVVPLEPEDRDLPEPVVIYADDEPEPTPTTDHVEVEEELVYTSESDPGSQPQA